MSAIISIFEGMGVSQSRPKRRYVSDRDEKRIEVARLESEIEGLEDEIEHVRCQIRELEDQIRKMPQDLFHADEDETRRQCALLLGSHLLSGVEIDVIDEFFNAMCLNDDLLRLVRGVIQRNWALLCDLDRMERAA